MPAFIDLTGKRFSRWTVIHRSKNNRHNQPTWLCRCVCGVEKIVTGGILSSGQSKSCGCHKKDVQRQRMLERNTSHGLSKTKTYKIWSGIQTRCLNPNSSGYPKYGAKGVTICERWNDYENFLADMGECPDGMSIDRINNDLGYSPENCRWVDMKTQQNNRTNNNVITINGETKTFSQWADISPVSRNTIRNRINSGWCESDAIMTPRNKNPPGLT